MDEKKKTYTGEEMAKHLGISPDRLKPGGGQFHLGLSRKMRREKEQVAKRAAKKKGKSQREGKTTRRTNRDMEARRKRPIDNDDNT